MKALPTAIATNALGFLLTLSHTNVWLSFGFGLSGHDGEALMPARGVLVTSEAIRKWCRTFGQANANQ
jgi:hypothetical protein